MPFVLTLRGHVWVDLSEFVPYRWSDTDHFITKPDPHTVSKQCYTQVEFSSCSVPDSDSLCSSCCTHRSWVPYPDYRWQCCLSVGGTRHDHLLIMAYQSDKLKTCCDICMEVFWCFFFKKRMTPLQFCQPQRPSVLSQDSLCSSISWLSLVPPHSEANRTQTHSSTDHGQTALKSLRKWLSALEDLSGWPLSI